MADPDPKPPPPLTIYDTLARWGLLLIAACCVLAAGLHAKYPESFDQTTGIFLGMAAVMLVIREVTRFETPWFKFEKKVHEEVQKAKRELESQVDTARRNIESQVKEKAGEIETKVNEKTGAIATEVNEKTQKIEAEVTAKTKQLETEVKQVDQQVGFIQERGLPGGKQATPKSQRTKKTRTRANAVAVDPDDPNKGKFGGSPINKKQHRRLAAKVEDIIGRNRLPCEVTFWVESTDEENHPLEGEVTFYLHPSFGDWKKYPVDVENGRAEDEITSWGSFTLGAVCIGSDGKECKLELDLAELPGVSQIFKDS